MKQLIKVISISLLILGLVWLLGTFGAADVGLIGLGQLIGRGLVGVLTIAGGVVVGQIGGGYYA